MRLTNRIAKLEAGQTDREHESHWREDRSWLPFFERWEAFITGRVPEFPRALREFRRLIRKAQASVDPPWDPPTRWCDSHPVPDAYRLAAESQHAESWRERKFPAYRAALERLLDLCHLAEENE